MSTIRPTHLPPQPQSQPAGGAMNDARAAAQRAFFQAALGGAAKPAAPPAPTEAAAPPAVFAQPVRRMPDPAAEQPQKILRPGSLLDIRV